ncbi:PQQ-binding-like beta-propeller repeat protein [Kitasatospora aburaviensis]
MPLSSRHSPDGVRPSGTCSVRWALSSCRAPPRAVLRDAQSGAMLWQFPDRTKLIRGDALALSTDSVLTVVESKEVRCLDIRTGQIRWSHSLHVGGGEVSDGTHIAAAGTALYVAFARHLWRLDPSNGKVVWTYQLPGDLDILTGLKPATGLLLARNSERAWFAIAPDTGTELWTYPTSSSSEDQTIAGSADGRIYFNGQDEIHVVTAADGKVLAPLKANGQIVPEHGLVVGKSSDATEVAAWSLANGRRLWTAANARVVRMTGTALQLRMIPQGVGNRAIDIRTGSPCGRRKTCATSCPRRGRPCRWPARGASPLGTPTPIWC